MMNVKKCLKAVLLVSTLTALLSTSALAAPGNNGHGNRFGCNPTDYLGSYQCTPSRSSEVESEPVIPDSEEAQISICNWFRITPCYKLDWQHDDLQTYVVVAKKGSDYTIWTRDELTEAQKVAVYESFSSQVNGMFGAKYENCQFMYADGSTLNGVTINNDYISFDAHSTWSMYAVGCTGGSYGPTCVDYITDEPYIVHHMTITGIELATDYGTALAGEPLTVYAHDDLGYAPFPPTEQMKETVPCNHVLEYQEFHMFDDSWFRITPCYKLNWQHDGLQQYVVVAKKGNTYTIWTRDQLSEEEQVAIYESFSTQVNGMFGAKYANCQFMYANGSTLNGVTINDDYISFDAHSSWSMYAVGSYLPSYEKIYEKGGDTLEFTFLYGASPIHR